jgi:hypothetical protein
MMKLLALILSIASLTAFGQAESTDRDSVFDVMSNEICGCSSVAVLFTSPSLALDSCYRVSLAQHKADLLKWNIDITTEAGNDKIDSEVLLKLIPQRCRAFYGKLMAEVKENNATRAFFKGQLVSQRQLLTGGYEIVIENNATKETKTFTSGSTVKDQVDGFEPGYEITVEYITVNNPTTHKDELEIKKTSVAGTIKVDKH